MIDPTASDSEKLASARDLFERSLDWMDARNGERATLSRIYHNTDGCGQWNEEDLQSLREEGRPALAFNLAAPKCNTIIGMLEDVRQKPVIRPVGSEDRLKAKVWNALLDQVREHAGLASVDGEAAERGIVIGEGNLYLDVISDPDNPSFAKLTADFVPPVEVKWDPASRNPDRSDAGHFSWDKWLSWSQFKVEYPDALTREEFSEFLNAQDGMENLGIWHRDQGETSAHHRGGRESDYDRTRSMDYYDRKRGQVRVVHIEYVVPKKRFLVMSPDGQVAQELSSAKVRTAFKRMQASGQVDPDLQLIEQWAEVTYWLEFIRDKILYDAEAPVPFKGLGMIPFSCFVDWEDHTAYGVMRALSDPQAEINKSHSVSLDHQMTQAKPGYIAEEDAIPSGSAFEEAVQTGGAVAYVKTGALTASQVIPRIPPVVSDSADKRMEMAVQLLDRIAGIGTEMEAPARHAEAAVVVQIRYRRAQLALSIVFRHYRLYQLAVAQKIVQAIMKAFPDEQIEAMLGNQEKFRVQDGKVIALEKQPGEDGKLQFVPTGSVSIRDLREFKYNLELDTTTENTTLRLLELAGLMELAKNGIPVDPTLAVRKATSSRYEQEVLEEYAEAQGRQQAQAAEKEAASLEAQIGKGFELEGAKVEVDRLKRELEAVKLAEARRHNVATETLTAVGQDKQHLAALLTVWERMDAYEKSAALGSLAGEEAHEAARSQPQEGA